MESSPKVAANCVQLVEKSLSDPVVVLYKLSCIAKTIVLPRWATVVKSEVLSSLRDDVATGNVTER
jgi:hypothetical protein